MAYWAFLMAMVAVPSLIISIGGVFLIYATLAKTAESIVVSDKNSRDETRAYVHVEEADLRWGNSHGDRPCIQLTVLNAGHTPAKWFMVRSKIIVRELTEDGFDRGGFTPPDMSDREWKPWSALGGGERLSFESFHSDDFERLKDCFKRRDKFSVNVTGVVRYETVLSEIFETEFWFTRRPMPGFSETIVSSVDKGGITIRETKEIPRKLQRAVGVMRTYAFVEKAKP